MLSRAFRQVNRVRADGIAIDPENRLLWRANTRRRDAESLIDSMHAVSGLLDPSPGRGTVPKFKRGNQASTAELEIPASTLHKRALYWPVFRKDVPVAMDVMRLFDFPPATSPRGRRATTRVPPQSLALLNSELILNAARRLRASLPEGPDEDRVRSLYLRVLARSPSDDELGEALAFLDRFSEELTESQAAKPINVRPVAWNRLCHSLLICNEFIHVPWVESFRFSVWAVQCRGDIAKAVLGSVGTGLRFDRAFRAMGTKRGCGIG